MLGNFFSFSSSFSCFTSQDSSQQLGLKKRVTKDQMAKKATMNYWDRNMFKSCCVVWSLWVLVVSVQKKNCKLSFKTGRVLLSTRTTYDKYFLKERICIKVVRDLDICGAKVFSYFLGGGQWAQFYAALNPHNAQKNRFLLQRANQFRTALVNFFVRYMTCHIESSNEASKMKQSV